MTVWRPVPVPAFEDRYLVSDDGQVKGVKSEVILRCRKGGRKLNYLRVYLITGPRACRVRKFAYIHHLVCAAFHGPRPEPGMVVHHRNHDSFDNRAVNLCWITQAENQALATEHYHKNNQEPESAPAPPADVYEDQYPF